MKRWKFWLIERLNKNPEYCWTHLVCWALEYRSFWSLFFKNHIENDYKIKTKDCTYCGKCQIISKGK